MLNTDLLEVRSSDPDDIDDPLAEATAAINELRQAWEAHRDQAATVEQLNTLGRRLDQLERRSQRPGATTERRTGEDGELEQRAFDTFLRRGRDGLSAEETRILSVGGGAGAGVETVPDAFIAELVKNLVQISPMRQLARVSQASSNPVLLPKRTATMTGAWVAEGADASESDPTYAQLQIDIFEARVFVDISNQLLEDSAFDLAAEMARDFAEEFARLENAAFVNGNGSTAPEGFLTSGDFTTINGSADVAEDLIDLFHSVPSTYAARGTWVMNRATMGEVRKVKTSGTGVYLWADSLAPGNPSTLLGRPVVEMPDLGTIGVGSPTPVSIAFGDWSSAYRIFDRVGLTVLRDPFTQAVKSRVRFHCRKRTGGELVLGEAVKGLVA